MAKAVRSTSIAAYRDLVDSGVLTDHYKNILKQLHRAGASTANELYEFMGRSSRNCNSNLNTRLGELRDAGGIVELEKRPCLVTGKRCIVWSVSGKLPNKIVKRSKKEKIQEVLELLTDLENSTSDLVYRSMVIEIKEKVAAI